MQESKRQEQARGDGGRLILLTGGSGYVGGRLLRRLEAAGANTRFPVRCLTRHPEYLLPKVSDGTEVVAGDVLDPASLDRALCGVHSAFYLVHSMGAEGDFAEKDAAGARNFAEAAARQGVRRVVYLGGLGEQAPGLSRHLRSRQQVGDILRGSGVQTIELRASVIIGAGSLSFELIRALVERVPVMITPKWVSIPTQPIAIEDVLSYLLQSLDLPGDASKVYEIGGSDVVSYGEMMRTYARVRELRRLLIPVPVLTPYLSSLWLGLVTPVYARVGRSLIEGVRNTTLVRDNSASRDFGIRPVGVEQAMRDALLTEDREFETMRFSDFFASFRPSSYWGGVRLGSRILDSRTASVSTDPETAFRVVCSIGGANGYFGANGLWRLRGLVDRLLGGVGMRPERRHSPVPEAGDVIDWWRVERVEHGRLLRLRAEMKVPGRAWLDFDVSPSESGSVIRQTAVFDPLGLAGLLYWYALYPAHGLVFSRMLRGISERCARRYGNSQMT